METCPITETLKETEGILYELCHKFKGKIPGVSFEELISEAQYHFFLNYHTWQPELGKFSTWIYYKVEKGLQELQRQEFKRGEREKSHLELERHPQKKEDILRELLGNLSDDSRTMFLALLETSEVLTESIRYQNYIELANHLGWSITKVWLSIRELIKEL